MLLPVDHLVRYDTPDRLLQDIFEYPISGFHCSGNAHDQLDQLMVEEGFARFQAYRHAHLVEAHEQQFR